MVKCILVDDEQDAVDSFIELAEHVPELEVSKIFNDPLEALNYIRKARSVELVFLDIDMPLLNGIELAKLCRNSVKKLVFTSSHSKFALEAFRVDADDFLLKPFGLCDLLSTMNKLYTQRFPEEIRIREDQGEDFLYIKNKEDGLKLVKVAFNEIVVIESLLNYVRFHTLDKMVITHISLKEVREVLKDRVNFVQLHRSFIFSKSHISIVDGNVLTMVTGAKFSIGESYREELNAFLQNNMLKAPSKNNNLG